MAKKTESDVQVEEVAVAKANDGCKCGGSIFTNMKIVIPVLCVAIVVLLSAVLVQALSLKVFPNNDPRGSISIVAVDTSGNTIKDVEVSLLANGRNQRTNADGVAVFRDLPVGDYQFKLSKKDFAARYAYATVELDIPAVTMITTDTWVARSVVQEVEMLKTSATISGYATVDRIMTDATTRARLGGAELMLDMTGNNLVNSFVKTTANAQGEFTFNNLPEGVFFSVYGEGKASDGIYYECFGGGFTEYSFENTGFIPESDKELIFDQVKYGQFAVTSSNRMQQDVNGSVAIYFSQDLMPIEAFAGNFVTVKSGSSEILVTPRVVNDALVLDLVGNSWYAEGQTTATISLTSGIKSSSFYGAKALAATTITLVKDPIDAVAPDAAEYAKKSSDFGGTLTEAAEPAEGPETLFAQWNYEEGMTYIVYLMNEDGTWKNLNLTASKVEIDNGKDVDDDDFEITDTVWRVNLVGALGTAAQLRALEQTAGNNPSFDLAIVAVKGGKQQVTSPLFITVSLVRA